MLAASPYHWPTPDGSPRAGSNATIRIRNFRTLADVSVRLESPLVVVAEDGVSPSLLLHAIRCLVDRRARPTTADFGDPSRPIELELADPTGAPLLTLRADRAGDVVRFRRTRAPHGTSGRVVFLGAGRRAGLRFTEVARRLGLGAGFPPPGRPSVVASLELLKLCEACIACQVRSAWILVEAPEIFLGPHAQRALASLLRALAGCGNQVIYTTHSPNLIDAGHTDEIVRLAGDDRGNVTAVQAPHTPPMDVPDLVRRLSSFDRERNGMFFARRVLVVEGASERLSLPFAFRLLGHEPDAEGVAIVDAGGKGNLPFVARTLRALAIPSVVLHDRDAPTSVAPSLEDGILNRMIEEAAGRDDVVEMAPDFEFVSGLPSHVRHKPSRAWQRYAGMADATELPVPIANAIGRLMDH
jgi:hypothetical protein